MKYISVIFHNLYFIYFFRDRKYFLYFFRRRKQKKIQQPPTEVDCEGQDVLEADESLRIKWELDGKDSGYSRQSSVVGYNKDGHYSQVWNDPNIGTPDLQHPDPREPIRLPGMTPHPAQLVTLPTPPNIQHGLYDRSEHVYEKPK